MAEKNFIREYLLDQERALDSMVRRHKDDKNEYTRLLTAIDNLQGVTIKAYKKGQVTKGFYEGQKEYLDTYRKIIKKGDDLA